MSFDSSDAVRSVGGRELPAGVDLSAFRDGADYATAQAELAKLVDANGQGAVDWSRVVQASASILATQAKDLTVSVWLAAGCLQTRGLPGLADGLYVLRCVITACWDTMTPAVSRLRGRRNQIEWLTDQLEPVLGGARGQAEPVDPALRASMADDWNAIDAFWSVRDDEAPSFHRVRRLLESLPELAPAPVPDMPTPAEATPVAAGPDMTGVAAPAPSARAPSSPMPVSDAMPVAVAGSEDIAAQAAPWLNQGAGFVADCLERFPEAWLPYRLNRMLAWATLDTPTFGADGSTRVPPPSATEREALQAIVTAANPVALARFCESRIAVFPFWLDLSWYCAQALHALGHLAAAAVVKTDTGAFVARAPDMAIATFSDGSPFLAPAARAWLGCAVAPAGATDADDTVDAVDGTGAVVRAARAAAATGRLADGLDQLESLVRQQGAGRERYRLRLVQCELVRTHGDRDVLRYLTPGLVADIEAHGLASWEPDLAGQALALAALEPVQRAAQVFSERERALAALARVDLAQAWRLLSAGQ